MTSNQEIARSPFQMDFDIGTIKHLGLQMYSTLPPVIGELVANGWDANATKVEISIPETPINEHLSEIVIRDNGIGMSDQDIREKYLIVGRDRRESEHSDETPDPLRRKVMGRKGIGKFSAFGIAKEIDIESVKGGESSHFQMNYDRMLAEADKRSIEFPPLPPSGTVSNGTTIRLKQISKFRSRRISIDGLRKGLARRFSVIGAQNGFEVAINGSPITVEERNLQELLEKDADGNTYLWEYDNEKIKSGEDWTVSGWIGSLSRTSRGIDGVDRGITLMARGKLVQEPFVFEAVVGQQYALSHIVGELHTEFVDEVEDTIGTNRNTLVWDTDANAALKEWGQREVNKIAREWGRKRSADNQRHLEENEVYREFQRRARETGNRRALNLADKLVRQAIGKNPTDGIEDLKPVIQTCLDFLEFDAFWEIAEDLAQSGLDDVGTIFNLFQEWQIVEAKEMSQVTKGRITTIEKLQHLIERNALEVPTLHDFLKEFPWVIDPRWTLVDDEVRYSDALRNAFPEPEDTPESDKRIDFLCVRESTNLVVVEIKRPRLKASMKELGQIEEYVSFTRNLVRMTTDPEYKYDSVTGYLLCGGMVDNYQVREKRENLAKAQIYVRNYFDLLETVRRVHQEFIDRYDRLRNAKQAAEDASQEM